MAKKFYGTLEELKSLMGQLGIQGRWELEPNGVYMLRMEGGVNMHWASSTKSLWFDGPIAAQQRLAGKLAQINTVQMGEVSRTKLLGH